jgi:WD40 repeat protein
VTALAFHPDGQRLVSGAQDGAIKVWELETGVCERTVKAHWASVRAAALDADGRRLVSVGGDNTMSISDLVTGVCLHGIIEELLHDVTALAIGPGARQLVSGGEDKALKVWDLKTGLCLATWQDDAKITCAAVSECFVAAGTFAGDVVILEIVPPSPPLRL